MSGSGSELPGLLGPRSWESLRAVLDMGLGGLIQPSGGETEITCPSGTVQIPLSPAPSGRLLMITDEFERAVRDRATGGAPDRSLKIHSRAGDSRAEHAEEAEGNGAVTASSAEADMRARFGTR